MHVIGFIPHQLDIQPVPRNTNTIRGQMKWAFTTLADGTHIFLAPSGATLDFYVNRIDTRIANLRLSINNWRKDRIRPNRAVVRQSYINVEESEKPLFPNIHERTYTGLGLTPITLELAGLGISNTGYNILGSLSGLIAGVSSTAFEPYIRGITSDSTPSPDSINIGDLWLIPGLDLNAPKPLPPQDPFGLFGKLPSGVLRDLCQAATIINDI